MSVGIAFEGCGCRAAFHVGAVEWLASRGFAPSVVTGASSGALVAAAVAFGRIDMMRPVWLELVGTNVFQWRRLARGRWPFAMTDVVGTVADKYFAGARLGDAARPLGIVVTQLRRDGLHRRLLTAADPVPVPTAILASCFIPILYSRMVPIDRRPTFDGAWMGRAPVAETHDLGASKTIACVSDAAGRLLRGLFWTQPMPSPPTDYRVLFPVKALPLGGFDFDPAATRESFEIGRRSAERFMREHGRWIAVNGRGRRAGFDPSARLPRRRK